MDSEFNHSESAINLSRSQGPSAATTPINTESPSYDENDEPEVSQFFTFFVIFCPFCGFLNGFYLGVGFPETFS